MIERKTWEEFRQHGFIFWINMLLHTFGWIIVIELDEDSNTIKDIYPARSKFRGFSDESMKKGFIKISEYMKDNADILLKEAKEEDD